MKTWAKGALIGILIAIFLSIAGLASPFFAMALALPFKSIFCNMANCTEISLRYVLTISSISNIIMFGIIGSLIGLMKNKTKPTN